MYLSILFKNVAVGRNNPNCKHKSLNDNFFEEADCEGKAYLLDGLRQKEALQKEIFLYV